ncbi:MAG: serpin family protein [Bacteroidales bacterium]|nr:serpin family protein [Bacteroidales bacterium]
MKKILFSIIGIAVFMQINAQNLAVKSINNFGLGVYKQLPTNENVFISPYSTSSALAMTYAGAVAETEKIMAEVMSIEPGKDFFIQFNLIQKSLLNNNNSTIKTANSLWIQQDYKIEEEYLEFVKETFGAPYKKVDFKTDKNRERARKDINKWVENQTKDKIQNLISPTLLNAGTRLVLTNAIYFKSAWEKSFDVNRTKSDLFYINKTDNEAIDFMNKSMVVNYYEDNIVQAIELPYKENALSMLIFLPKQIEGLTEWEKSITSEFLRNFYSNAKKEEIKISFPKFKMEYKLELSKVLTDMGMGNAFSKEADFSKINKDKKLKLDKVIHQTFIALDEAGTEAAAATAVVVMRKTAIAKLNQKVFKANHPFFFVIVDNKSNSILFMGRMAQP